MLSLFKNGIAECVFMFIAVVLIFMANVFAIKYVSSVVTTPSTVNAATEEVADETFKAEVGADVDTCIPEISSDNGEKPDDLSINSDNVTGNTGVSK